MRISKQDKYIFEHQPIEYFNYDLLWSLDFYMDNHSTTHGTLSNVRLRINKNITSSIMKIYNEDKQ